MAHYGGDYTTGRYTRPSARDYGPGYGSEYGDIRSHRGGWYSGRGQAGSEPESTRQWGTMDRSGTYGPFDEFRGTHGPFDQFRGGFQVGPRNYYGGGWGRDTHGGFGDFGHERFGGYGQDRFGGYGSSNRGFAHREMGEFGGRMGHEYDEGFGDRVRRGWNRVREGARDWMGRGYDRGW